MLREKNTIKSLIDKFPNLEFKKTDGIFDHRYAVDFNVLRNSRLICGIQVKPKSYLYNMSYVLKAKSANKAKNKKYQKEYGVNVIDIISSQSGEIYNKECLKSINAAIDLV